MVSESVHYSLDILFVLDVHPDGFEAEAWASWEYIPRSYKMLHHVYGSLALETAVGRDFAVLAFDRRRAGDKYRAVQKPCPFELRSGLYGYLPFFQDFVGILVCRYLDRIVDGFAYPCAAFHGIDRDRHSTFGASDAGRSRVAFLPVAA